MDLGTEEFARRVGEVIENRMRGKQNDLRCLAAGASFESWFAFEARMALEDEREKLEMAEVTDWELGGVKRQIKRFSICNEYGKVDLYISDEEGEKSRCHAMIEFKIVCNNKNREGKRLEVWEDLFPSRARKQTLIDERTHVLAVPIVVGKRYWYTANYPGGLDAKETEEWDKNLRLWTPPKGRRGTIKSCYQSEPYAPLVSEYLDPGFSSYARFEVLARLSSGKLKQRKR